MMSHRTKHRKSNMCIVDPRETSIIHQGGTNRFCRKITRATIKWNPVKEDVHYGSS